MLKITKVFNNNAIQAVNEIGSEVVILGKGIAFGKKPGELADSALVEKTFSLTTSPFATRLTEILSEIPAEYFRLTNLIIQHANQQLNTQLSNGIYISLTDHIYHAVLRAKNNQRLGNGLSFEIQRLYKTEFAIGLYSVELIQREMQIDVGEDEAAFIALHIFNARTDSDNMEDTYRTTQIIKDILNLVGYHFNLKLDENSYDYARFVTHLQHFALRLFKQQHPPISDDDFLYQQTKIAYPQAFQCVEKIDKYLAKNFQKTLNQDEQLYLIIHIQRVIRP
ncbi:BglG family transcription antiterminator LicT [Glaesserella sp.]|uniref:BglG family transcription antiterminator LicT n=1 Tax=Glaesserella sp. TaxID=2094731 RepID=UPI00359FF01E